MPIFIWLLLLMATLCLQSVPGETHACAHRGDNEHAPENTVPAFESAVNKKAPMIEFDVQRTRDGQLILMHDATVDRTTNGTGKVAEMTFEEIRRLDAGAWFHPSFTGTRVPTLEEALSVIPASILCNVHLKGDAALGAQAARVLSALNRLDHCFLACTLEQARAAREVAPDIMICNMSRQGADRKRYVDDTIAMNAAFIQLNRVGGMDGLAADVARLKAAGIRVNWFGESEAEPIRALAKVGIEYILTDKLDLCQQVLAEMNASAR